MLAWLVGLCLVCHTAMANTATHFLSADDLMQQIVHNQTKPIPVWVTANSSHRSSIRVNLVTLFPTDFMSDQMRLNGGFVLHLALFVYLCVLLAVVIDSYFIGSLHYFSTVFRISPNISGSTVMALGTSSPEFFTTLVSVFLSDNSTIATGAIVGSSIVNTLAIPGICGLATWFVADKASLSNISCFPVMRDLLFYGITVIIFVLSIKDNSVDFLESLVLLFMYLLYIFALYVWCNIKTVNVKSVGLGAKRSPKRRGVWSASTWSRTSVHRSASTVEQSNVVRSGHKSQPVTYLLEHNPSIRLLLWPVLPLVTCTIPRPTKHSFVVTFGMCCAWIAGLTYLNLWMVSLIGHTFQLSETVSGMTILALGTNLPELISSFILVRKYHLCDMAICHTIGSNIFDILICLGLPWFLQIFSLTISSGADLTELGNHIIPLDHSLLYFVCLSLVISIIALNLILYLSDWKLTVMAGILCLFSYCTYIGIVLFLQIYSLL